MLSMCEAVSRGVAKKIYDASVEMNAKSIIFISINDMEDGYNLPAKHNVLSLKFSDITPVSIYKHGLFSENIRAMTGTHAKQILEFLDSYHEKEEEYYLIVHCAAGICRSGAISEFVYNAYGICERETNWHNKNKHIMPNHWVQNVLYNLWNERKEDAQKTNYYQRDSGIGKEY